MSEEPVYEGRLCAVRKAGRLLRVEPATGALIYDHDELLSELQLVLAAIMGEKA